MSWSYADTVTDEDGVDISDHDCRASQCTEPHGEEITVEEQCPKCGGKLSTYKEAFGEIVICENCRTHKHVEEEDEDKGKGLPPLREGPRHPWTGA